MAAWTRSLLRYLAQIALKAGPGYRIQRLPAGGITLELQNIPGGGSSLSIQGPYHIKAGYTDYLGCVSWNGTTEGTTTVYIAKPWKLRMSLVAESKYGVHYSYTYSAGPDINNPQRTETWPGGNAENELVTPPWVVSPTTPDGTGDQIYAVSCPLICSAGLVGNTTLPMKDPTGAPITLLLFEGAGARAWAGPT